MLYKLKAKIRCSKLGDKITQYLYTTKIFLCLYKILSALKLTAKSREKILVNDKSLEFFEKNKDRINNIISKLEDEKSKIVYRKNIDYRCCSKIENHPPYSIKDQYFPKGIINLSREEVFVDCGAFDGDTILKFVKQSKNKYKKIIGFETNTKNFEKLDNLNLKNFKLFKLGVWSKKDTLSFIENDAAPSSSKINETKVSVTETTSENNIVRTSINVDAIDNIKECEDMTFLKMDIEGAELNALKGAEKTIRKNKPKLAICIYHCDEDIINIPEWIINLNIGYKVYIRQHMVLTPIEIIVYAI